MTFVLSALIMLAIALVDAFVTANLIHVVMPSNLIFFSIFLVAYIIEPLFARYID